MGILLNRWKANHLIAIGRVLLALIALMFSTSDPSGFGFELEVDDIASLVFLVYCIIALIISQISWWYSHILFPAMILIDILAFIILPLDIEPDLIDYFVVADIIAGFVILETAMFKRGRLVIAVAILLNLLCLLVCIVHANGDMAMLFGEALRRVGLLGIISLLLIWIGNNVALPLPTPFDLNGADSQAIPGETVLAYAMKETMARGGAVRWAQYGSDAAPILIAGDIRQSGTSVNISARRDDFPLPTLFDLRKRRALVCPRSGVIEVGNIDDLPTEELHDLGVNEGLTASLAGHLGGGRLVLTGIADLGRTDLLHFNDIAKEVARALDLQLALEQSKDLAVLNVRQDIARDLHDGVAQSLAGTRYWLAGLRSSPSLSDTMRHQLGEMAEALEMEHSHVRELIDRLRTDDLTHGKRDLSEAVRNLAKRLQLSWHTQIDVVYPQQPIHVRASLSFEAKQILREAIANAVRHGQAKRVELRFKVADDLLHIAIHDDGRGFPDGTTETPPRSIAERVKFLDGALDIKSRPGNTLIEIAIPMGDSA